MGIHTALADLIHSKPNQSATYFFNLQRQPIKCSFPPTGPDSLQCSPCSDSCSRRSKLPALPSRPIARVRTGSGGIIILMERFGKVVYIVRNVINRFLPNGSKRIPIVAAVQAAITMGRDDF